jgi:hypothetical protein
MKRFLKPFINTQGVASSLWIMVCFSVISLTLPSGSMGQKVMAQEKGSKFSHPGLLLDQTQLNHFSASIRNAKSDTLKAAYQSLLTDPRSSDDYLPNPQAVVQVASFGMTSSERAIKDDAMAAYLNALRWVETGSVRHLAKAIEIMDAWAVVYETMEVAQGQKSGRQAQLESAWILPMWANAGEIIKHHHQGSAKWPYKKEKIFRRFIDRLYQQSVPAQTLQNNWGAAAAMAAMAAGVFMDDERRYLQGLRAVTRLLPTLIGADGEVYELRVRDCGHPQYSLAAFVQAAEIAFNQGDTSIWLHGAEEGVPTLARGMEYMARALIEGSPARDCRSKTDGDIGRLHDGYGPTAVRRYLSLGYPLFFSRKIVEQRGIDGASFQFLGWTSLFSEND